MKVFLSWSGPTSRLVASELRGWLPNVIQSIQPWMSEEDIGKGSRWWAELGRELEAAIACIICITRENVDSPWLHFEAGATARTLEHSFVCPLLVGLQKSDLRGPLVQFQAATVDESDMLRVVHALNRHMAGHALRDEVLERAFSKFWPDLQLRLEELSRKTTNDTSALIRTDRDLLQEVLERVREIKATDVSSTARQRSQNRTPEEIVQEAKLLVNGVDKALIDADRLSSGLMHEGHLYAAEYARFRIAEMLREGPATWTWYPSSGLDELIRQLESRISQIRAYLREQNDHLMNQP